MGPMNGKPQRTTVERILFNAGAVLGSLCLVLAALALVFGLKPLIFTSGSMGPAIPTGSLALAVPVAAAEIAPGEVVSVVASDGTRITHRVVSADSAAGLVLKGDANAVADLQPFTGATADRVLFSIPGLGYLASWMASPWVFLLGGLLCAYLIYVAFFSASPDAAGKPRAGSGDGAVSGAGKPGTRRRAWLGIGAMAVVIAVAVPLGAAAKVESTQAAWTASGAASSAVTAAEMPAPGVPVCTNRVDTQKVQVTWTAPSGNSPPVSEYRVSVDFKDTSSEAGVDAAQPNMTLSMKSGEGLLGGLIDALGDVLGLLGSYDLPVVVSVVAVYPGGWESPQVSTDRIRAKKVFLGAKTLRCQ